MDLSLLCNVTAVDHYKHTTWVEPLVRYKTMYDVRTYASENGAKAAKSYIEQKIRYFTKVNFLLEHCDR